MLDKSARPQARRGLAPWGLTFNYKFEKASANLFAVTTVYMFRMRLPKYVVTLHKNKVLKESSVRSAAAQLFAKIKGYTDSTGQVAVTVPVLDVISERPEIIIRISVSNDVHSRDRIKGILNKLKRWIADWLSMFREVLRKGIENSDNNRFMSYRISQTGKLYFSRYP